MATTLDLPELKTGPVVDAALALHDARGNEAAEVPLVEVVHVALAADTATVPVVLASRDRLVELVVDIEPFEALAPAVHALAARGWEVVALAPAPRMGEAHRALRGAPCSLQPWWLDDGDVRFGRHESP